MATLSDRTLCLWTSLASQPSVRVVERGGPYGDAVALSPDGRYLAAGGFKGQVRVWDLKTGSDQPRDLVGLAGLITALSFSQDSMRLVAGSDDGVARAYNLRDSGAAVAGFGRAGGPGISAAAFNPDGTKVAVAANDVIAHVWTVAHPDSDIALSGHGKRLNSVEFNASGRLVATASDDGQVRIWDLGADVSNPVILPVDQVRVTAARFSPDGAHVLTISDAIVSFIWTTAGKKVAILDGHSNAVWSSAWSRDGRWVATTSSDGTARIYPVGSSRSTPYVLGGNGGPVVSASFDQDLRWIITASSGTIVWTWPFFADAKELEDTARSGLGRCLSASQLQDLEVQSGEKTGANGHGARPASVLSFCD